MTYSTRTWTTKITAIPVGSKTRYPYELTREPIDVDGKSRLTEVVDGHVVSLVTVWTESIQNVTPVPLVTPEIQQIEDETLAILKRMWADNGLGMFV